MGRGKRVDIAIGAHFEEGWSVEREAPKSPKKEIKSREKHDLYLKKEHRRGKIVTLVGELHVSDDEAKKLLKSYKSTLGCGGSVKNGFLELQGEVGERIKSLMIADGFRFR